LVRKELGASSSNLTKEYDGNETILNPAGNAPSGLQRGKYTDKPNNKNAPVRGSGGLGANGTAKESRSFEYVVTKANTPTTRCLCG